MRWHPALSRLIKAMKRRKTIFWRTKHDMITVRASVTATALFIAISAASAAGSAPLALSEIYLTRIQQREIYFDLNTRGSSELAPPGFMAKVGEAVPSKINLAPLPASTINLVSVVKNYDYVILYYFAMVTNEVLLVDPDSRKIVAVITP
jgi:hypothetical protein